MTTTTERPAGTHAPVASPAAARLRRPTWRDPRLLVGVVLVAASVALGSWAVSSAQAGEEVYVASGVLTAGDTLDADDLQVTEVRLGAGSAAYLRVVDGLPDEAVVLRTVQPGELVPTGALGTADDLDVRAVAVPVTAGLSDLITAGAVVDLWHVPPADREATEDPADDGGAPRPLVEGVTVAQLGEESGTFVTGGPVTVHVLVATDDLPAVLAAAGGEGTIAVVPVGGAR
ncbi:hypothetical protein [Cellulosimicrobium marinum]|uniref:hypothetical protein n=1 Tax=Cellulosimicrobium marinum TaxID=1638992 RepID=UPI001E567817|nr:hypothetical protein [Cellulosimicrobium marinum]MCB7137237.1 hypothetical protein [Cellulosimicrobium marinum]